MFIMFLIIGLRFVIYSLAIGIVKEALAVVFSFLFLAVSKLESLNLSSNTGSQCINAVRVISLKRY